MLHTIKQNLIGQDKLLHSKYGNLIFLVTFVISLIATHKIAISFLAAIILLLAAAISKELYDKFIKRTFVDWYDIVAAFVPYCIVKKLNK